MAYTVDMSDCGQVFVRSLERHKISSAELRELENAYEKLFLAASDSEEANNGRQTVETLALEFLFSCSHTVKFCPIIGHILHRNSTEKPTSWKPRALVKALAGLEKYAVNLWMYPWRQEYRTILMYTGFFKYYMEPFLEELFDLFLILGYTLDKPNQRLLLTETPSPDQVRHLAIEMLLLGLECEIYATIYDDISDSGYHYGHVHESRCKVVGKAEDCAKWILINCNQDAGTDEGYKPLTKGGVLGTKATSPQPETPPMVDDASMSISESDAEAMRSRARHLKVRTSQSFDAEVLLSNNKMQSFEIDEVSYGFPDAKQTSNSLEDLLESSKKECEPKVSPVACHSLTVGASSRKQNSVPPQVWVPSAKSSAARDGRSSAGSLGKLSVATEIKSFPQDFPACEAVAWPECESGSDEELPLPPYPTQHVTPTFSTFKPQD